MSENSDYKASYPRRQEPGFFGRNPKTTFVLGGVFFGSLAEYLSKNRPVTTFLNQRLDDLVISYHQAEMLVNGLAEKAAANPKEAIVIASLAAVAVGLGTYGWIRHQKRKEGRILYEAAVNQFDESSVSLEGALNTVLSQFDEKLRVITKEESGQESESRMYSPNRKKSLESEHMPQKDVQIDYKEMLKYSQQRREAVTDISRAAKLGYKPARDTMEAMFKVVAVLDDAITGESTDFDGYGGAQQHIFWKGAIRLEAEYRILNYFETTRHEEHFDRIQYGLKEALEIIRLTTPSECFPERGRFLDPPIKHQN